MSQDDDYEGTIDIDPNNTELIVRKIANFL